MNHIFLPPPKDYPTEPELVLQILVHFDTDNFRIHLLSDTTNLISPMTLTLRNRSHNKPKVVYCKNSKSCRIF